MIMEGREEWRKWYKRKIWLDLRDNQLKTYPFCAVHLRNGQYVAADVVNHITAHKGDWDLFNNPHNLESVCKQCHDGYIQGYEKRGFKKDIGSDGWPEDNKHPFNKTQDK